MFDIFKKNKSDQKKDDNLYINIGALLIHVAKIDENYSEQERKIIKKTLLELGLKNEELDNIFKLFFQIIFKVNFLIFRKPFITHFFH